MNQYRIKKMARGYTRKKKSYKVIQREQIADFMANNHEFPWGHFLTLPHMGDQEKAIRSHELGRSIEFTGVEIHARTAEKFQRSKKSAIFKRIIIADVFDVLNHKESGFNSVGPVFTGMFIDPCSTITTEALQAFKKIGKHIDEECQFAPIVISMCSRLSQRAPLRDAKPISLKHMLLTKQFKLHSSKQFRPGVLKQIGAVVKSLQANRGWRFTDYVAETWRGGDGSVGIPMFTIYGVLQRR